MPFVAEQGYIIALNPQARHATHLALAATQWLGVSSIEIQRAVNSSTALLDASVVARLPLYTRMALSTGERHDYMQVGSLEMLGCLLSHLRIWQEAAAEACPDDRTILVLEEDAQIDAVSADRLRTLLQEDTADTDWDILMLETGHITVAGPMRRVGALGMTWAVVRPPPPPLSTSTPAAALALVPPEAACRWMGTRGYLLRASGARILMRHVYELTVQVDALLGLVATFDPAFRMVWPRANIAHPSMLVLTTVQQDRCIKCHLPTGGVQYAAILLGIMGAVATATVLITLRVISVPVPLSAVPTLEVCSSSSSSSSRGCVSREFPA